MHYPTKALYTADGYLKEDSELQIIHDSIVTADLSDEEDEERFNQELYRTALKEAKKSTYYQQRANNGTSAAIRTQLNEQRLRKQLHSLQSEWAQQASNRQRAEHVVSMDSAPMTDPTTSRKGTRKSRRRPHGAQDFVVIKGQDLERLQSISSRKGTSDKQNEYYSFHDDYVMERERERQRLEEEERRKNRWVVDDMDIVQPYDDYKFSNRGIEQQHQQHQQYQQYQQQLGQQAQQVKLQQPPSYQHIPPEQFHLPIPPPALSHSPISSRSEHSLFYNNQESTNSNHSLSMPPPLAPPEDNSSSCSSGGNSSPEIDHHSDGGALFHDQYGDCEEEDESVLPPAAVQQTQSAASPKPKLNPPRQHQSPSAAPADLAINNDVSSSSISAKSLSASLNSRAISGGLENKALQDTSQPSADHLNLPPDISKLSDGVVSRLEKQASVLFKPSSFHSSSSPPSPPPPSFSSSFSTSSSSFVSAIDDTSTIKPYPQQRGNYPPNTMSTDSKVSPFSAKGIYGRFSKKKTSTPRVQSSLDNPQISRRQAAPSQKSYAPSVPSYREPYAPSVASTVVPRHRQPQHLTNYAQSVYAASTDTRSLNSYKSRKGELHVPIPLNNGAGCAESRRTVRAAPVEIQEPQNRFAAAAAAAAAAPVQVSSQQQAVDYGEQFYDAWQSTKQVFQDWATAKPHPSPPNTIKIPITGIALAEYPKSIHSDHSDGSGGLQYETYSIIDRSRSNSPVLMPDENASLRSPLGTLRHTEDVDMIPTSLSSSVDAHVYDNVYAKNGSQRTGLMRKPVSPRGAMGGLDPASREKLLHVLRIFANALRQLARMSFILRPIDAIADMAPGLEAPVIILEMIIMMWLLYELSIVLEAVISVIKRVCQPAIMLGRLLGFGFK